MKKQLKFTVESINSIFKSWKIWLFKVCPYHREQRIFHLQFNSFLDNFSILFDSFLGQSEKICVVCLDNTVEVVYIPCGHAVVCTECAYRIGVGECCPTCREVIADVLKIFL